MPQEQFNIKKIITLIGNNIVTLIFVGLTVLGFIVSTNTSIDFFLSELMERVFRNSFLVLSLIIPVVAGLGMNFGIVIGAMAAQMALIVVRYFDFGAMSSLLLCILMTLPMAMLFGYLTGKLYNKTRGQEMIASLIVGYFANGVYQFILLFVVGAVIPVSIARAPMIIKPDGIGIRMTVDMGPFAYSVDNLWRIPFMTAVLVVSAGLLIYLIIQFQRKKKNPALGSQNMLAFGFYVLVCLGLIVLSIHAMVTKSVLMNVKQVPVVTGLAILALCIFNQFILKTKLGQDFRSVGQSQQIAGVSGINVDKTRILAVIMSTVLASWGMLIFLQNMGTLNVYSAHSQIGMFSVASLLVGGASTTRATVKHALIGVLLFNSMFIMSPTIGNALLGDALYGEYFRTFMVYAVIALSLGLYVWRGLKAAKQKVE